MSDELSVRNGQPRVCSFYLMFQGEDVSWMGPSATEPCAKGLGNALTHLGLKGRGAVGKTKPVTT